ncbi:MAG: ABC transporter permease, partial [Lachnospiraceae bacterium]|nr:ABC transporter permease [Lachnospiraceae bacterium]
FLVVTAQHFLAGGYLPLVFLPATVKGLAPLLPSGILMDGAGMMLTARWNPAVFGRLAMLLAGAVALAALCQKGGERE